MGRSNGGIDRLVEQAFGNATLLSTSQLSWALRVGEQTLRIAARAAGITPRRLGAALAWTREDARRVLLHLRSRPRRRAA